MTDQGAPALLAHGSSPPRSGTLRCTPEHPFFVPGEGWVPAGRLAVGDELVSDEGEALVVTAWEVREQDADHFNFEVEDWHTYFVAEDEAAVGVWVHNLCDDEFQRIADLVHSVEPYPVKLNKYPTAVTEFAVSGTNVRTFVVSSRNGKLTRKQKRLATFLLGKHGNVEFAAGLVEDGLHAETRGLIHGLGKGWSPVRQACSHFACDRCAVSIANSGVRSVTGLAKDNGGKITRLRGPLEMPDEVKEFLREWGYKR